MSIKEARTWCTQSIEEIKRQPNFWLTNAMITILFVWSQDLVPYAGTVAASIVVTLIVARLFHAEWKRYARSLLLIGILNAPVTALWTILFSMHSNTDWLQPFSTAWSIPVLFFMSLASLVMGHAIAHVVLQKRNLDQALSWAWKGFMGKWRPFFAISFLMAVLFTLSLAMKGLGFVLTVPFFLAVLRASYFEVERSQQNIAGTVIN